ncbi:MAG: glycosyltransferase [Acidimicrobiia bacterium]|nr:glycosyltransferase [Acidimicrobiia bacterium]
MTTIASPRFDHLLAMTDERATFEHARLGEPRPEHGYCTDDMARVLVVTTREPDPSPDVRSLAALSLQFLCSAQGADGGYRNRMDRRGRWLDRPSLEDCWGRSVWALGTAAAHGHAEGIRQTAVREFERAARRRSPWSRAMAFAAIGAAELLTAVPDHPVARELLRDATALPDAGGDASWPWPEPRLAYANAVLPEAMIAAGSLLSRPDLLQRGLHLLGWLLDHEMVDGHLSVTPVDGSAPGATRPAFDQQPIEVAALADACARAATVDPDDRRWSDGVAAAVSWFLGDNDAGHAMFDPVTGGGYDGLHAHGPNLNQGTESTLALVATLQHGRHLVPASR